MATIKAFTSLEQSKKLAEILPLESADMFYNLGESKLPNFIYGNYDDFKCYLPCWSLAALLGVLPGVHLKKYIYDGITKYYATLTGLRQFNSKHYDNPVDACYEMILELHKLKML